MDISSLLSFAGSFPSLVVTLGGLALIGLLFFGALESVREERTDEEKDRDVFFFATIAAFLVLGLMMLTLIVNK